MKSQNQQSYLTYLRVGFIHKGSDFPCERIERLHRVRGRNAPPHFLPPSFSTVRQAVIVTTGKTELLFGYWFTMSCFMGQKIDRLIWDWGRTTQLVSAVFQWCQERITCCQVCWRLARLSDERRLHEKAEWEPTQPLRVPSQHATPKTEDQSSYSDG